MYYKLYSIRKTRLCTIFEYLEHYRPPSLFHKNKHTSRKQGLAAQMQLRVEHRLEVLYSNGLGRARGFV